MAGHWTDKYSFVGAAVLSKDTVIVSLANDELSEQNVPYTYYTVWLNRDWKDGGDSTWEAVANSVCDIPSRQFITLGPNGQIRLLGAGHRHEENILSSGVDPNDYGLLRGIRSIGGKAYVCGMNRQVYRRDGINQWVFLSQSIPRIKEVVGFEAIDGFSEKDIYAVGWKGEIWNFDGNIWQQKDSPTNYILLDSCCAGDGLVYACGRNATLIRGRGDTWESLDLSPLTEDLWSLSWFNGKLYLASTRDIFYLDNAQLIPIDFGKDSPTTCRYLTSGDGVLWSVGEKDLFSFDGVNWMRID